MKKLLRSVSLALALCLPLSACNGSGSDSGSGNSTQSGSQNKVIEVVVPHYKVGENVGAKFFMPQVERFNKKYEGKYKVKLEEIPQDMYVEKIKQLGQQNKLPALIEGGENTWLEEVIIPGNKFKDLSQWLDKDSELKSYFFEDYLEHNTKNGRLFSLSYPVVRPMTVFYNGDMFKPSKSFAEMTWDEVAKELGNNKIAFMTGENAWTSMLTLSSLIAVKPGGAELLKGGIIKKVTDFNNPIIVESVKELQQLLQNYSSSNTIGAAYADAANSFMSKNSALICNGSWMVGDFLPEASDKWSNGFDGATVHGDVLPGNVGLANVLGYGWWIPDSTPADQAEAAWAFIAFMNSKEELEQYMLVEGGTAPNIKPSEEFLKKRAENRLLDEYVGAVRKDTIIAPAFGDAIPGSIANTEFGKLLPKLIDNSLTAEQFCAELTKKAAESAN